MNKVPLCFLLILVALIILGLFCGESSIISPQERIEGFDEAPPGDVDQGSSEIYKWGYPNNKPPTTSSQHHPHHPHRPHPSPYCPPEHLEPTEYQICKNCDITLNRNINRYVLKSSVPPCPDTSQYATKNMVKSCPDMNKYILKSKVPKDNCPDIRNYVLKSQIPACPDCPLAPKCPICPKCVKYPKCKKIYEYNIKEHPEFNKYINKKGCYSKAEDIPHFKKTYIRKDQCPGYHNKNSSGNRSNGCGYSINGKYNPGHGGRC